MGFANNVIPAWMLDPDNEWIITYTDGSFKKFYARDRKQAYQRFMSEGDHAYDLQRVKDLEEKPDND